LHSLQLFPSVPSLLASQEVPSDPAEAIRTTVVVFDALNDNAEGFVSFLVPEPDQITFLEWSELTFLEWSELTFHGGSYRRLMRTKVKRGAMTIEVMKAKPKMKATCSALRSW
jgi:hypothetical protein